MLQFARVVLPGKLERNVKANKEKIKQQQRGGKRDRDSMGQRKERN